ncbi:hypothetical protein BGX21_002564 [Mortierella sp. AD011]|nr:hypothetical protein BGX20_002386 [Mortierella sp. AD010]KAF9379706.1 hypothetical protein BGX21_002564 [Mortierella sp. AD011]
MVMAEIGMLDPTGPMPLGRIHRYILLSVTIFCALVGYLSTYLFQRISKKDNNLRQRGRYLVTLQGYVGTTFVVLVFAYQSFKFQFPCVIVYWASNIGIITFILTFLARAWRLITRFDRNNAIYQTQFADPADLAALGTFPNNNQHPSIITPAAAATNSNVNLPTPLQHDTNINIGEQHKVFEVTRQTTEEIEELKRWYNRYRTVTDKQMLKLAIAYEVLVIIVGLYFQIKGNYDLGVNPIEYSCHTGIKFFMIYITVVVFMFFLSPFMIFQLRDLNDGFGIRNELVITSIVSVPCTIMYFVVPGFAPRFTLYFDKSTFMALIFIVSHVISTVIPLFKHYKANSHSCSYTSRFLQRRGQRNENTAPTVIGSRDISKNVGGVGYQGWSGPEDIPLDEQRNRATLQEDHLIGDQVLPITTPTPPQPVRQNNSTQGRHPARQGSAVDQLTDPVRKNSFGNLNMSMRNLVRNQQREGAFSFGRNNTLGDEINSKKTDWDEFVRVLEDRTFFKKISAFTVREFCAENTRFLYEVSRLEKRAIQYEHLRSLAMNTEEASQQPQQRQQGGGSGVNSTAQRTEIISHTDNTGTARQESNLSDNPPPRIKKIVSASSMSSTVPMLQRPMTSHDYDDSEPSSPLGSFSFSAFKRNGSSNQTLPNLEEDAVLESKPAVRFGAIPSLDAIATPTAASASFDPLPMPPTLLIQFEYIYKTFIVTGARLELNLSHDTLQDIHKKARRGEWRSGMFDAAIFEIQELLFRDVWPKFVTSSQGLNYNGRSGSNLQFTQARLKEVDMTSDRSSARGSSGRTSAYFPEQQSAGPSNSGSPIPMTSSLPRATPSKATIVSVGDTGMEGVNGVVGRSGSGTSTRSQGRDTFNEEPNQTGFKTWLKNTSRRGISAVKMNSDDIEEESIGIVEQSRKSMGNRRSDNSGFYSTSIQSSLAPVNRP